MKARAIIAIVLGLGLVAGVWLAQPSSDAPTAPLIARDAGVDAAPDDAGVDAPLPEVIAEPVSVPAPVIEGPPGSSIALAIAPDAPDRVVVLAERVVFGSVYALVTIDRSSETDATIDATIDEPEDDPCESEEENDDALCDCLRAGASSVDAGWLAALGRPAVRYELVQLAHTDTYRVIARAPLTEPVLVEDIEGVELRANDMDGDGRTEITAIFGFTVPDCDTFQEDGGTLGAIFDASDLHLQGAFVRESTSMGGDSDVNSDSIETVWRAADEDGDGHADLRVRATTRTSSSDPPDYETYEHETSASAVCPYDLTTDRWQCPDGALPVPTWFSSAAPDLSRSLPVP